jgi:MarR family transcriptional regulator, 2-MHQ and catechol-resistance regulon repressor
MNKMSKRSFSEMIDLFSHQFAQLETMAEKGAFTDLTMKQVFYIETLGQMDKPTFTELAGKLGLSKPSVTAIVGKLAKKGYVRTVPDKEDKRSSRILLTGSGNEINRIHRDMHDSFAKHITTVLNEKEQRLFADFLGRIIDSLS